MSDADYPRSLAEFQTRFPDDTACAEHLARLRWPNGFACPACGACKAWRLDAKPFTWECGGCGRQTSVTAGTVLHGSKVPLRLWFWAAYLMGSHSNGISALQLFKQLGLGSYKTAWLLCGKLRRAMAIRDSELLFGIVEVDETTLPQRTKNDPVAGGHGRSLIAKMPVIGAIEMVRTQDGKLVPGRIRLEAIPNYKKATLQGFITAEIAPGARIVTDDYVSYRDLPEGYMHDPHLVGPMAAHIVLPGVHRVFSLLKRWALGVYHGLRKKHLQRYLDEFVYRFNRRRSRPAAFDRLLGLAAATPPASYRRLVAQTDTWTLPLLPAWPSS